MAGRAFAQVFRKPGIGLHFFVQNSQRRVVAAIILTERHIADIGLYVLPFGHGSCSLEEDVQEG